MNTPTITTAQVTDFYNTLATFEAPIQPEGIVVNFSFAYQGIAPTEVICQAVESLGLDPRDVIRGSLSVTPDEVRWSQVARDAAGAIVVRNGKPVAFSRVVKVVEASGGTPTPDPAV